MNGRARAPGAGTILNALATRVGSAFAIDLETTAEVHLASESAVSGSITEAPDADTRLIEACVSRVTEEFGNGEGGEVRTTSEVPMAAGLKSSSAAANATILATLSALNCADRVSRPEAARLGVDVAREVGVTITGAFDDASASMLGGITITDNTTDEILQRDECDWSVLVWTPPEQALSADADVDRCQHIAPMADLVAELARERCFTRAMTVNGLAYCAALGYDPSPMVEVMSDVAGVSLSGTGPSFTAVGEPEELTEIRARWDDRPGETTLTSTHSTGASIDE